MNLSKIDALVSMFFDLTYLELLRKKQCYSKPNMCIEEISTSLKKKVYSYCSKQFFTPRAYQCIKYNDCYSIIITLHQLITWKVIWKSIFLL